MESPKNYSTTLQTTDAVAQAMVTKGIRAHPDLVASMSHEAQAQYDQFQASKFVGENRKQRRRGKALQRIQAHHAAVKARLQARKQGK